MTKAKILAEIKRIAASMDGLPLLVSPFQGEIGVGRFATQGDALVWYVLPLRGKEGGTNHHTPGKPAGGARGRPRACPVGERD